MATNLSIDPELIDRAVEVAGAKTKKAAVTQALEEFIAIRQQRKITQLFGTIEYEKEFDYKAQRQRR